MTQIEKAVIPPEQIDPILDKLEEVLANVDRPAAIVGCLAAAVNLMYPDCTADDITDGVMGMSKWLVSFLSQRHPQELPTQDLPSNLLN